MLLGVAWFDGLQGSNLTQLLTQAALAGSGFFVITVLAGELAGRLAREELSARGNMEMARQQAALNRLVIEEMQDGILVVDRRGRVRAANPAARRLLAPTGMSRPAPFQLRGVEAWQGLVRTVEQAFAESSWPEAGRDVTLAFEPDAARTLRVRVRFTRHKAAQANEDFCVLFLEDVRNMQARSRQEKLAAMGRVKYLFVARVRSFSASFAVGTDGLAPGHYAGSAAVYRLSDASLVAAVDVDQKAPGFATVYGRRGAYGGVVESDTAGSLAAQTSLAFQAAFEHAFGAQAHPAEAASNDPASVPATAPAPATAEPSTEEPTAQDPSATPEQ